jgi:hypothetical protein
MLSLKIILAICAPAAAAVALSILINTIVRLALLALPKKSARAKRPNDKAPDVA